MSRHLVSIVGNSFNCSLGAMAGNTETLVRHCLVGAHAAGCAQAELQTATVCGSAGGCGARAVSRKTPIYFMIFKQFGSLLFSADELKHQLK